ncbi:mucin-binding protein [Latilactobacillus sakei]|uniref:mucin-binding protein n=1 Tax=Latilactobacillus sakei TaxID=1599 RepID=UPI003F533070
MTWEVTQSYATETTDYSDAIGASQLTGDANRVASQESSETLASETTKIVPAIKGESTNLVKRVPPLPKSQTQVKQKVARAANTYKIQDLIDQGVIKTTVTWDIYSQSEDDISQGYTGTYYPKAIKFSVLPNNVLQPGDSISFSVLRYTGKLSGQGPVTMASVSLAGLGQYDGKSLVLDSQYIPDKAVDVSSTLPKSSGGVAVLTNAGTPDYTATYAGSTINGTKSSVTVIPATHFNGFQVTQAAVGSDKKGTLTLSGYTKDQTYFQSALDGIPNLKGVPTDNYVRIYRINKDSAQNINKVSFDLKTYMPALMPDGQHMAAKAGTTGPMLFIKAPAVVPINNSGSVAADASDNEIIAKTSPQTYGALHNSDGSMTLYLNYGNLTRPYELPIDTITKGVMNNAWDGTQAGLDYALNRLSNNNYSSLASSTYFTMNISFNDPSITNSVQATYKDTLNNTGTIDQPSSPPSASTDGQTTIKVHYADQKGKYIKPIETHYGWPDTDKLQITTKDLTIPGYTLDKSRLPLGADPETGQLSLGYPKEAGKVDDILYRFTQNKQKINVTYIDDTTGKQLATDTMSGVVDENSKYNTQTRLAAYEKQGYQLVNDDTNGATLLFSDQDQSFTVHLKHAIKAAPDETKQIKRTIHYRYQSDKQAAPDVLDKITFTRHDQIDQVTNQSIGFTKWTSIDGTTTFAEQTSPLIKGYTADQLIVPAVENINQDSADITTTVTYTGQAQKATVTYQRSDNQAVIQVDQLTGVSGQTSDYRTDATLATLADKGYTVADNPYPSAGLVFDDDIAVDQNVTVLLNYNPYYNRVYFKSVPNEMDFGQHALASTTESYQPTVNQSLSIQDERALGSKWTLKAALVQPFMGDVRKMPLEGDLTYQRANQLPTLITAQSTIIATTTTTSHAPVDISGQWQNQLGPQLVVPVGGALVDQYAAQVEWTLEDGVANN